MSSRGERERVDRGLAGICFDTTSISEIDGVGGRLRYRHADVAALLDSSLSRVATLLVEGEHASAPESARALEAFESGVAPPRSPMDAVRGALVSAEGAGLLPKSGADLTGGDAIALMAWIAAHLSPRRPTSADDVDRRIVDALAEDPPEGGRAALRRALILLAEHGASASTFTARVVTSTGASVFAALTAATCAFEGPKHGGAVARCEAMLEELERAPDRRAWFRDHPATPGVPGFGHRVYRTVDPRVDLLRSEALAVEGGHSVVAVADELREHFAPLRRHGVAANVDLYLAVLCRVLRLPPGASVAVFAVARVLGWCAHIREQTLHNVLIRPRLSFRPEPRGIDPSDE
jgi:citrate synthase